jgi:hypothetical protein
MTLVVLSYKSFGLEVGIQHFFIFFRNINDYSWNCAIYYRLPKRVVEINNNIFFIIFNNILNGIAYSLSL